jgi:hypothetical protein
MQPHGKKIFYTIMIDKLRESCKCENMTYLLGSNDEILNEEYIQEHIQSCAQIILKIIQDHGTLYSHMVGKMEIEKGLKKTGDAGNTKIYLSLGFPPYLRLHSLSSNPGLSQIY